MPGTWLAKGGLGRAFCAKMAYIPAVEAVF
jgi:hypothetical protein